MANLKEISSRDHEAVETIETTTNRSASKWNPDLLKKVQDMEKRECKRGRSISVVLSHVDEPNVEEQTPAEKEPPVKTNTAVQTEPKWSFAKAVSTLIIIRRWLLSQEETEETKSSLDEERISASHLDLFERPMSGTTSAGGGPEVPQEAPGPPKSFLLRHWNRWVVDSSSSVYYYWTTIVSAFVMYNVMMLIARHTFTMLQLQYLDLWLALDYTGDAIYVIDSLLSSKKGLDWSSNTCYCCNPTLLLYQNFSLNWLIGYLMQGIMVRDPNLLRQNYIKSVFFYMDVVSVLPTDLLFFYFGINTPLLRMNRLFRSHRLTDFIERTEARTSWPNLFRVFKLIAVIFIVYHWIGCFFYLMSRHAGIGVDPWAFNFTYIIDPIFYPPYIGADANYCFLLKQ